MFKFYNIFKKEVARIKKDEPYYHNHASVWKYFFRWRKLVYSNSVDARLPWISFPVIDFLDTAVKPGNRVFEFGGGGSSVYFIDKGAEVYTIEHNKEWFDILSGKLKATAKWHGIFVTPEKDESFTENFANPDLYFSADKDYKGYNFKAYASSIDQYESFDFVLVDGRARPSCMKHGIAKLKSGGFLILDNSDRAYYTEPFADILKKDFKEIINFSGPTPFCSWFNRTSVWQKK